MISYEPFWNTLQDKSVTKYQLIYYWGMSSNTLRRMSHNEPISSTTLNELCLILDCRVEDIIKFDPSPDEQLEIAARKQEIENRKNRHKK